VAQVLLTHEDISDRHRYLNSRNTLLALLAKGIIPVINENDTVAVEEIKVGDNDKLSALVAGLVDADLLVLFSDIAGLCDHDPGLHAEAQVIPVLREISRAVTECAGPSISPVSVGGMSSKIEAARTVQAMGIPTFIGSGKVPGILPRIFEGKIQGTLILPSGKKLRGRQYWIAYAQKPRGDLQVDAGARKALVEGKKSLLPSGVIGVQGKFEPGDAVRVLDPQGAEFARGLVRFSSSDLHRIKGLKTSAIEAVLGACDYEEVIHKDDLVLTQGTCP
jgi:glutamate 5-kinase